VRRAVASLAAVGLLVAMAGFAIGAPLKEKSVEFTAEGETERVAECKQGQEAVAGGFFGERPNAFLPAFESKREGKRGWSYRLYGDEAPATAYVYCDKKEPGLKAKSVTHELAELFVPETVTARCGRGKEAVSGGFEAPFTKLAVVASKRSGKRTWEAQFVGPVGVDVSVFVYCDKAEPGLKTKSASTTVLDEQSASVSAKCKHRRQLRSGGFESEFGPTVSEGALVNESRRDGKRRWDVTADSFGGEQQLTAYAYCEKKRAN
jgi:hypothetical protein